MSANALFRPTFADLRAELARRAAQGASTEELDTLVEGFLALGGDTPAPWVEYDGTVTWLYRDSQAQRVSVVGDILGHAPDQNRMTRLPGGDLFALTGQLPLDARIAYAFEVDMDGQPGQHRADPLNPKRMVAAAPLRALSILEMPNARRVPELDDGLADDGTGVVYQVVASADQATWARVWVFLPPGYDPDERRYPTLYLDGGESYLLSGRAAQIVDALQLQGEVVPLIAVFVQRDDAGHAPEEGLDARYVGFLADELVPWVDAHYATSTDPQERVIGGAGAGVATGAGGGSTGSIGGYSTIGVGSRSGARAGTTTTDSSNSSISIGGGVAHPAIQSAAPSASPWSPSPGCACRRSSSTGCTCWSGRSSTPAAASAR